MISRESGETVLGVKLGYFLKFIKFLICLIGPEF